MTDRERLMAAVVRFAPAGEIRLDASMTDRELAIAALTAMRVDVAGACSESDPTPTMAKSDAYLAGLATTMAAWRLDRADRARQADMSLADEIEAGERQMRADSIARWERAYEIAYGSLPSDYTREK